VYQIHNVVVSWAIVLALLAIELHRNECIYEPVTYPRVTLLNASRVWCSYTTQVGWISFLDTLTFSDRQTHVHRLPSIAMSCRSSSKNTSFITTGDSYFQFLLHTISQWAKCKYTNILILPKLCLNQYSEQISCMSHAHTRISSLPSQQALSRVMSSA